MSSKLIRSSNKRCGNLGLGTAHNKIQERVDPTHKEKDKVKMDSIRTTGPSRKQRRTSERQRKMLGSGATSIRALGICRSKQSLVAEVKASESDADSDSEIEPERGIWIIDAEPSATIATTKI